jgi:D-lactate dehydrogenase
VHNQSLLSPEYHDKFSKLKIIDSIQYLNETILPRLTIQKKKNAAAIHPVCSATKLNLVPAFENIASQCADRVIKPAYAGCCGMAGDRGFLVPEITKSATDLELKELADGQYDGYYASGTTCEIALTENSGRQYEHIMYLVDEVT